MEDFHPASRLRLRDDVGGFTGKAPPVGKTPPPPLPSPPDYPKSQVCQGFTTYNN